MHLGLFRYAIMESGSMLAEWALDRTRKYLYKQILNSLK